MRAVLKKASSGTRRIFGSIRCKKIGFFGTEEIFGTRNPLLRYGMKRPDAAVAAGSKKCPSSREAFSNHFRRYYQPFLYICV